ncbi:MAG: hypothetical protein JSW28_06620, partial [Thermoplasmata archaeon]
MNRKETLGRLLLALATAFIMVAGSFAAAVYPALTDDGDTSEPVAVREQDFETREIGEAPISAKETMQGTWTQGTETEKETDYLGTANNFQLTREQIEEMEAQGDPYVGREKTVPAETTIVPADHGTRGPMMDCNGPYGTMADPLYEGTPVNFQADVVGDDNDNYRFRFDINNDGVWDGPGAGADGWGAYGQNTLMYQFNDNHIGQAVCQAWDGVCYSPATYTNRVWDEAGPWQWYYYSGYAYRTFGLRFRVFQTTDINQIGFFRYYTT